MKQFLALSLIVFAAMPAFAQLELRKNGAVILADYVYKETTRGWCSAGFVAAGHVQGTATSGWVGFYPVATRQQPSSVFEYSTDMHVWPQPATTHIYVRGIPSSQQQVAGGLPTRAVATDVYGRQIMLPMQWMENDVVKINVEDLAIGTYALNIGRGVVIRIGSQP
ncbi:MAG: hypothetical protein J5I53_10850 [Bradyrhizobiaceae bacterium]|nr:hypothetical protein [Bradyrhizobiaceae bacterium]